jgi:hypothetical protein
MQRSSASGPSHILFCHMMQITTFNISLVVHGTVAEGASVVSI